MPRIGLKFCPRIGLVLLAILPTGCTQFDPVTRNTLGGSGLGAATGAIIGHQSGNAGTGALIGATAGAIGGALVGNAQQARSDRDAAYAYAAQTAAQPVPVYPANASAITNTDVIFMTQNGLSDDVIINSIRSRGGQFDTNPHALTSLKASGVSNTVISVLQNYETSAVQPVSYVPPPVPPRTNIVVVEPVRPRPIIIERRRGYFDHHHHCAPRRKPGLYIHGSF